MKKIFNLFFLIVLFTGCNDISDHTEPVFSEDGLIVKLNVSDLVEVKNLRQSQSEIRTLYMLVFNEHGLYQSKHQGEWVAEAGGIA
ncbi:MAG: hypothetical protein ACRC26_01430, partial [Bacteroidales bacterium]